MAVFCTSRKVVPHRRKKWALKTLGNFNIETLMPRLRQVNDGTGARFRRSAFVHFLGQADIPLAIMVKFFGLTRFLSFTGGSPPGSLRAGSLLRFFGFGTG